MTIAIIAIVAMFLITIGSLAVLGVLLVHSYKEPLLKNKNLRLNSVDTLSPDTADLEEQAKQDYAKKRAAAEEEAFQKLMNYNADIAYGILHDGITNE